MLSGVAGGGENFDGSWKLIFAMSCGARPAILAIGSPATITPPASIRISLPTRADASANSAAIQPPTDEPTTTTSSRSRSAKNVAKYAP
jgi:hypothetical protein